jgi:copper chaperone CopZ
VKVIVNLLLILGVFCTFGYAGEGEQITFKIEGDMCTKCADSLRTALKGVEGVTAVTISLEYKNAVVEYTSVTLAALQHAMIEAGYVVNKENNTVKDDCNEENCMGNNACCPAGVEKKK